MMQCMNLARPLAARTFRAPLLGALGLLSCCLLLPSVPAQTTANGLAKPLGGTNTSDSPAMLDRLPSSNALVLLNEPVKPSLGTNVADGPIIFDKLLSTNSSVLMTNAEFRRMFGRKVIFKSGFLSDSFDIERLHPSVLVRLKLDVEKARADQLTLEEANKKYLVDAEKRRQDLAAQQAAAIQKAQADAAAAAAAAADLGDPTATNRTGRGRGRRVKP